MEEIEGADHIEEIDTSACVDDCVVGKPGSPVREILQTHHPHALFNLVFLFLHDTIGCSIDGRHIHDD